MARIATMMVICNHASCACMPVPSVMTTMAIGWDSDEHRTNWLSFYFEFHSMMGVMPGKLNQYVEAIVIWINLLADLTLEIKILINL
jgi:hypothetical protein